MTASTIWFIGNWRGNPEHAGRGGEPRGTWPTGCGELVTFYAPAVLGSPEHSPCLATTICPHSTIETNDLHLPNIFHFAHGNQDLGKHFVVVAQHNLA